MTPYRERSIRFVRLIEWENWAIKLYSITREIGDVVDDATLDQAWKTALEYLQTPRASVVSAGLDWSQLPHHGVAILTVHRGREAIFALLDFWVEENMIHHQTWTKPAEGGTFENISASGLSVCVWEMAVQIHEREAWLKHVYNREAQPDFNAYLSDVLNRDL